MISPTAVAKHEASHAVVGLSLGLRLVEIRITPGAAWAGHCTWLGGERFALACMFGAGVVWDRMCQEGFSSADAELCRKHLTTNAAVSTCYRIAKHILLSRRSAHRLIADALLRSDGEVLTGKDVRCLALGLTPE